MLRLTLVLSVIIALTLAGDSSSRDRDRDRGDRRGSDDTTTEMPMTTRNRRNRRGDDTTTVMPMTTRRGRGGRGDSSEEMTTEMPETTRRGKGGRGGDTTTEMPETTRRGRGGRGDSSEMTTEMPETTRRGKGGRGDDTTTTDSPRGGRDSRDTRETRDSRESRDRSEMPDMGDMMEERCYDSLPSDDEYLILLQALFGNNQNAIYTAADALVAYQTTVTDNLSYRTMVRTPMRALVNTLIDGGLPDSLRFLLSLQDGTVIFDSNRGDENTYDRAIADNNVDRINENHNTRIAILVAQMSSCGVGYEEKISSSTGNNEYYLALRLFDRYASYGTVRVSYASN